MNAARNLPCRIVAPLVAALTFAVAGCGGGLTGSYTPDGKSIGGALIKSITFTSGDKVEITAGGTTTEATYDVDDKKVKITASGNTMIMTIDDKGYLDGGEMLGRFCKK